MSMTERDNRLGRGDLLRLIYDLCADARKHTEERCFGWAAASLGNAKLAAEAYAVLVEADAAELARPSQSEGALPSGSGVVGVGEAGS